MVVRYNVRGVGGSTGFRCLSASADAQDAAGLCRQVRAAWTSWRMAIGAGLRAARRKAHSSVYMTVLLILHMLQEYPGQVAQAAPRHG